MKAKATLIKDVPDEVNGQAIEIELDANGLSFILSLAEASDLAAAISLILYGD